MNACVIVMVVENILLKSLKIDRVMAERAQVYPVLAIFGGVLWGPVEFATIKSKALFNAV